MEQEILKLIRSLIPNSKKYLFDDAAIIEKNLVITSDSLVENTHFKLNTYTPEEIGWKALAVNLSDIASMGAKPLYALISLSLPKNINLNFTKKLYLGLNNCAEKYKTQIVGGNISKSKEINITITLIGKLISKNIGKRSNARPGDLVFTTGTFGDSACGLLLSNVESCHGMTLYKRLIKSHKTPIPQINLGQTIVKSCKNHSPALMDASDGLADCLIQISKQSNIGMSIYEKNIPLSKNLINACKYLKRNPVDLALYGGEDYQLIGTASKADCRKLEKIKNIRIIGEVKKEKGVLLKLNSNKIIKLDTKKIFKHF